MTYFLTKTYKWTGNPKHANAAAFSRSAVRAVDALDLAYGGSNLCITRRVEWRGDSYAPAKP